MENKLELLINDSFRPCSQKEIVGGVIMNILQHILVHKVQQRLYFFRALKKTNLCPDLLKASYYCTTESILTCSMTTWYLIGTDMDRKWIQRVIKMSQ